MEPKPKKCRCGCGNIFVPKRPWQKFFNSKHRNNFHNSQRILEEVTEIELKKIKDTTLNDLKSLLKEVRR